MKKLFDSPYSKPRAKLKNHTKNFKIFSLSPFFLDLRKHVV